MKKSKDNTRFLHNIFSVMNMSYKYYWTGPIEIYLKDMGLSLHRTSNWIS